MLRSILSGLREIVRFLAPIMPHRWLVASRALSHADGWMPPMFLISLFGVLFFINELLLNVPLMWRVTWVTWLIVGLGATWIVASRSQRSCIRFGPWGWTRPRWWFELSRLLWKTGLLAILSALLLTFARPNNVARWANNAADLLFVSAKYCFCVFFITATIGYAISFVRRLPRRGRAYECTHWFYVMFSGSGSVTLVAIAWPPPRFWPDAVLFIVCGAAGMALIIGGFFSIAARAVHNERARLTQ